MTDHGGTAQPDGVGAAARNSLPVSMAISPAHTPAPSIEPSSPRFPGESAEDFDLALARITAKPLRRSRPGGWWSRLWQTSAKDRRMVAFDGYRSELYDEKLERDRRYGTVYDIVEYEGGYVVRLEMPRRLASSSLRVAWDVPLEMPDYYYTVTAGGSSLTVKASVPGEALRRLSYVSTSFPADFMTRFEFGSPIDSFVHRMRNKVLELIAFKRAAGRSAGPAVAAQP